jgi:hypothetical protein
MAMRLVRRAADPARFDALAAPLLVDSLAPLFWGESARAYYEATLGSAEAEPSFLVEADGQPAIAVIADVRDQELGCRGQPAGLLENRALPVATLSRAFLEAMGELRRVLDSRKPRAARLLTSPPPTEAGLLTHALLSMGFNAAPHHLAVADLRPPLAEIERGFRKGHRAQLKWGRTNLSLSVMDKNNPDPSLLEAFRRLHADAAGRVTRTTGSWDAARAMIMRGEGRLVLSSRDGEVVGGTLIMDSAGVAYYASGAYRRDMFDKPLAHWPLLRAMELSQEAGCHRFDIGDVTGRDGDDAKTRNIMRFKRGFTNKLMFGLLWSWHLEAEE